MNNLVIMSIQHYSIMDKRKSSNINNNYSELIKIAIDKLRPMFYSAASSFFTYTLLYPLDIIKTNYQLDNSGNNIFGLTKKIYNNNMFNFYRGYKQYILSYPIFWGLFFEFEYLFRTYIDNNYLSYICSTILSTIIVNPLHVVKIRKQYGNFNDINIKCYSYGLYYSLLSNMKLCIQFPLYNNLKLFNKNDSKSYDFMLLFTSKCVANSLFYPLDVIRSIKRANNDYMSIYEILKKYDHKRYNFMYKGLLVYNLTSGLNFSIMMMINKKLNIV